MPRSAHRRALASVSRLAPLALGLGVLLAGSPAARAQAPQAIAVPALPLAQALHELAAQARLQVLAPPELVAGKRAPAVQGSLTPAEALRRLLAGSGLEAVQQDGSWVIRRQAPAAAAVPAAPAVAPDAALPVVRIDGSAQRLKSSDPVQGYTATATQALGFDLSARETPATVNVISADFLRDAGARKLTDITAYVPGLSYNETEGTNRDSFVIRGFVITNTMVNGMRQVYNDQRRVIDTVERVEVVKGADGVEAAAADPGGSVNIITKKPQREFAAEVSAALGQFGYRKVSGDVTGALSADGKLQGRFIASYEQGGNWRPTGPETTPTVAIAPSLKWDYAPGSSVVAEYQFMKAGLQFDRGVAYLPGAFPGGFAPRDWSQNTDYDFGHEFGQRFEIDVNHRFDETWSARLHVQRAGTRFGRTGQLEAQISDSGVYADDQLSWNGTKRVIDNYFYGQYSGDNTETSYVGELKAAFALGGTRHETIVGLSTSRARQVYALLDSRAVNLSTDLFHPDVHIRPNLDGNLVPGFNGWGSENIDSYYAQWLGRWTPAWRTVLGVRHDDVKMDGEFRNDPASPYERSAYGDTALSYRAATSWDLSTVHTLFASYSDAHFPQNAFTRSGAQLKPLHNITYEIGLKSVLLDGRLQWTNSLFRNTQRDVAAADPTNVPPESFSVPFGDVRVQGFETQLGGRVTAALELTAGLSLMQSEVLNSEGGAYDGKRFKSTPNHSFSVFASYNWAGFGLQPLTTRLGVNIVGKREGNDENTFKLPGYTRVDAGLAWRFDSHLSLDLNIENLFDKVYYTAADAGGLGGGIVGIGNRRLVNATLRYAF